MIQTHREGKRKKWEKITKNIDICKGIFGKGGGNEKNINFDSFCSNFA